MSESVSTPTKILRAAQRLFNDKGYAATTLSEIASSVGIAQGNLTYHFPTKRDMVVKLEEQAQEAMTRRWTAQVGGDLAEDYVEHLLFAMRITWEVRFLLRDRAQFADGDEWSKGNSYLLADFKELVNLVKRIEAEGLLRDDLRVDFDTLTRTLWITGRYWMDHLREIDGIDSPSWSDFEQGLQHHLALLSSFLRPEASETFAAAVRRAMESRQGAVVLP